MKYRIILASKSPRRRQLLKEAGYDIKVFPSKIQESKYISPDLSPTELAERLAFEKARNVSEEFPDELVLGADTLCDLNGEIIGKAESKEHAEQIVRKIFTQPHDVITGISLINKKKGLEITKSDVTRVYPKQMSQEQIEEHIKGGSWKGKAGAYAIQETGDEFVERLEGSISNVIGLPMELLEKMLSQIGYRK